MKKSILLLLVLSLFSLQAFTQEKTVTGTITDEDGDIIVSAKIYVNGIFKTISDYDGKYSINVEENDSLTFRYIFKENITYAVAGKTEINVVIPDGIIEYWSPLATKRKGFTEIIPGVNISFAWVSTHTVIYDFGSETMEQTGYSNVVLLTNDESNNISKLELREDISKKQLENDIAICNFKPQEHYYVQVSSEKENQ